MIKTVDVAQTYLLETSKNIAVDFTCGHGFDTLFLAKHFNHVYAFDIQKEAILDSKERCKEYDNITFINESHEHVLKYVKKMDVGIFNCGYLPNGDKTITTNSSTVIPTLKNAFTILEKQGIIIIVLYPGFEHGKQEAREIEEYVSKLSSKQFDVVKFTLLNKNNAPYIIKIVKM